jgi:hypothetical protein
MVRSREWEVEVGTALTFLIFVAALFGQTACLVVLHPDRE